ncbi:MAG: putative lipid II flippase FtsW [Gammaproteobacteria bacterium]|nr:putative lipid II flippase FtsW [Gammaproteobacteria bacterium]
MTERAPSPTVPFDKYLLLSVVALLGLGILMVASASMVISDWQYHQPFHYLIRQLIYLLFGFVLAVIVLRLPIALWQRYSGALLLLGLVLLLLVLIPGIGHRINGSARWLGVGTVRLQVSEFMKFAMVVYLAGYLVRHQQEVCQRLSGFLKPLAILALTALLLLLEPDFGATVVITLTVFAMLYLGGAKVWQFLLLISLAALMLAVLAISSPYRMQRVLTFLHPWQHQYHSGYQLVQSLIAFGRGGIFGIGLGNSIQKLFYLPEAYTDFLFAVLAEELGLIGMLTVIGLYLLFIWRALLVGRRAQLAGLTAAGYMAYGFAVWIGIQAFINMGVNAGLLPTKGLTLPFMSYGGSSLSIICIVVALLLRIDYESRQRLLQSRLINSTKLTPASGKNRIG